LIKQAEGYSLPRKTMPGVSSRILVIGGTGTMGRHIVNASLASGHPTALLVRPLVATGGDDDPAGRMKLLEAFKARGADIVNVCFFFLLY
jgi:nucleoside-diphosphate-sugar epimerase